MEWFIKLHRQLIEWEWYTDWNTFRLFIHLVLKANHKDNKWRGILIKRWEYITSLEKLAWELNLSVRNIRTSIKKLETTSEVTKEWHSNYTLFKLNNYNTYQTSDKQYDKPKTNEWQASDNKQEWKEWKETLSQELEKFIIHWNSIFWEKRKVTQPLLIEYKRIRKIYNNDDFAKWYNLYKNKKLETKKELGSFKYLLSPLAFLKNTNNGFVSYL